MRAHRHLAVIASVSIVTGGLMLGCDDRDDDVIQTTPPVVADTPGVTPGTVAARDMDGVDDMLASAVEAAVKPDAFDDLTERFADNDRGRFQGQTAGGDMNNINAKARAFSDAWQAKYNEEFDINDPAAVIMPLMNLSAGSNGALAMFKATEGLPQFTINLIRDGNDWHIDIPDTYDGQSLREAVTVHLERLTNDAARWPADKLAAQRMVAHHVLAAIANTGAVGEKSADQMAPGTNNPGR
jgi:hypothetical protein